MALDAKPVRQPCCEAWEAAHEVGTDDDNYGSRIHYDSSGCPMIGSTMIPLPPVRFCPWCGDPKGVERKDAQEAFNAMITLAAQADDEILKGMEFVAGTAQRQLPKIPDVKWKKPGCLSND